MKIWENFFDSFFKLFLTSRGKNEDEDEKFVKMSPNFEFSISKLGYVAIFMKIWEKTFDPFLRHFWPFSNTFLTNRGKNKDEDKKVWKNEFDFWIFHIKIRFCGNFHENLGKKIFDPFCRTFWLIKAKMKTGMKKYGKMSLIFEFSISK